MALAKVDKFADLKKRVWFLIGALIVFRIGAHIPVPGIDPTELAKLFKSNQAGLLTMVNMFSGGALSRFTIFALGIMPYISASIILQLSSEVFPYLIQLKKEGEMGRKKITQYTRYATVILALVQSFGIATMLYKQPGLVVDSEFHFFATAIISLVTGTMFLMWLGEQITERGLGNGASMIITTGIISGMPSAIGKTLSLANQGSMSIFSAILVFVIIGVVTYIVVFVERAQRKIPVNYAKRQVGNKVMQGQSTHLPLKLNMAGVIPPIFASSIILFPATLLGWLGHGKLSFLASIGDALHPGQPIYIVVYAAAIIFFCYFYTALTFNPKDTADNLKKSGAFIPGIRPGENTAKYIEKVLLRLTFGGAIYIAAICLFPELMILKWHVPFYFGGTSLLIVVVVTMDFMTQVQSQIMSVQYEGLMKKANLKGF
ncbi:MAG: preprotein translocase subunit SecY [Burkholderiales bacterium]|jgi:preprotein translocase subunit SecY|nr:preprotein translocase subunit SecY [Burkholderiales bacterium]